MFGEKATASNSPLLRIGVQVDLDFESINGSSLAKAAPHQLFWLTQSGLADDLMELIEKTFSNIQFIAFFSSDIQFQFYWTDCWSLFVLCLLVYITSSPC